MKKMLTFFIYSIILLTTSCQSHFLELSSKQTPMSVIPPRENYVFTSSVWLSDNTIVFTVADSDRKAPDPFLVYSLQKQIWEKIVIPSDPNCRVKGFGFLEKLPNGNIGFINTCITIGREVRTIEEINISTRKIELLMDSGVIKVAGKFSFSPDMTELVQEDMTNRFLSSEIFYRKKDDLIQIVQNFTRVMYPDWSPHNRQIAFWGTENYLGGSPEDFTTLSETLELSSSPWDLFTSTPEGTNVVKVLSLVNDALMIKWSPKENIIAFSGTINGKSGVFLVNPKTSELTRIWATLGDFDWSPDGTKIVVLDTRKDQDGNTRNQNINIINVK